MIIMYPSSIPDSVNICDFEMYKIAFILPSTCIYQYHPKGAKYQNRKKVTEQLLTKITLKLLTFDPILKTAIYSIPKTFTSFQFPSFQALYQSRKSCRTDFEKINFKIKILNKFK